MIISIANHKGGVGKTTSVASLGVALSRLGKSVLLVDLDAQCNLTDTLSCSPGERSVYDSLRTLEELPIIQVKENLYLCPGSIDLVSMDMELVEVEGREYRLGMLLKYLNYDYILLDCPPSLGLLTINALTASDKVFIPLTPEALPAKGMGTLLNVIDKVKKGLNPSLEFGGVIITRYNRRKINRLVEESLRESFGELVFNTKIRENVDLSECPLQGQDIFSYSPDSLGAKDYEELAREIVSKLE